MMKKLILIFILGVCCAQCSDDNISPNFNDSQKNLSKSALWFQNSKNPYESLVGDNILAAIDSANAIGDNLTCDKDKLDDQAIKWFENVSDFYHASVSFPVDTSLLIITSTELDYFDEITSELYSGDSLNNSLHNLIAIEDDLVNSYAVNFPNRTKELESMLHLTSAIKHLLYGYAQTGIQPCSGKVFYSPSAILSWAKADDFDGCMRNKINDAGPLEIVINYGAGPGGWTLVAAADCAISTLSD